MPAPPRSRPRDAATAALALLLLLWTLSAWDAIPGALAPPLPDPALACDESDLERLLAGRWRITQSGSAPPQLGVFESECPAPAAAPAPAAFWRGRRLALVGDSVTRGLAIDLAVGVFECAWLAWDGAARPTSANSPAPASVSATCAQLHAYACTGNKHEDLLLNGPGVGALHFAWAPFAEDLSRGTPAALLRDAGYEAILVSLGFWDVAVKTEGADKSVAHHCAWMASGVALDATLHASNPRLRDRFIFWQPPYTEPRGGNDARIPHNDLDVVNGCSRDACAAAGLLYANTSQLLRAPAGAFAELQQWAAQDVARHGSLLTIEGYHPTMIVRSELLGILTRYFSARAREKSNAMEIFNTV